MDQNQDYVDYAQQAEAIKRRQALLAALGKQSQEAPIVGNTGLGQALAKIGTAYFEDKGNKQAETELRDNSRASQADLSAQLKDYMQRQSGTPATPDQPMGPPTEEGQYSVQPGMPAVPADPKSAVYAALASQHPEMKAIGSAGFKEMMPKIIESGGRVVQTSLGGPTKVLLPAKPEVINNQAVTFDENNTPTIKGDYRDKYTPVQSLATGPNGQPIMGATAEGTGKPVFAPQGTNVRVDLGQTANKAFADKIGEGRASEIMKSFEVAKDLPQKLSTLDEAAGQLAAGIKSGLPAEVALTLAKAGKALGLGDVDPTIANTETFRAKMASSVLDILKVLRPASDKDVQYAEKAAGGQITLDPETLSRLVDSARAASWNALHSHGKLIDRNREAPGAVEAGIKSFEVPYELNAPTDRFTFENGNFRLKNPLAAGQGKAAPEAVMNLDQYLQSRKGKK